MLVLVLLPLTLLLTLTHWVPTLAGIWLPVGTRISLQESPRLTRSAPAIPDLRYLVATVKSPVTRCPSLASQPLAAAYWPAGDQQRLPEQTAGQRSLSRFTAHACRMAIDVAL